MSRRAVRATGYLLCLGGAGLVVLLLATRLSGTQRNPTSFSLLPPATLDRLGSPAGEAWCINASPERQADLAGDERYAYLAWNSVCGWLIPALEPRWVKPDLYRALKYAQLAEGLEALECDGLWALHRCEESDVLVIGRWRHIAVMVAPDKPSERFATCATAQAPAPEPGETPWPDPPDQARQALTSLWDTYLTQKAATVAPIIERYYGFAAAKAKLRLGHLGGGARSPDCLLFCDGDVVGILLSKDPGIWNDWLAHRYEPTPVSSSTPPLNPELVIYEDTRLYHGASGLWVSEVTRAAKRLIRLISLGWPGAPTGTAQLYCLPAAPTVPEETWHICERHFLAASMLEESRLALGRSLGAADGGNSDTRAVQLSRQARAVEAEAVLSVWKRTAAEPAADEVQRSVTEAVGAALAACRSIAAATAGDRRTEAGGLAEQAQTFLAEAKKHVDSLPATVGAKPVRSVYGHW